MKLNLLKPVPEKVNDDKKIGYDSPVGWWEVTTEGDVEGRSTKHLGNFYGHVAEIAFSVHGMTGYSMRFTPIFPICPAPKPKTYQAIRSGVWISLGVESGSWKMAEDLRANWFYNWMDTSEVSVCGSVNNIANYPSVFIKLK